MTTLVVLLAVLVGVTLGLLGGGGSILMVPLLVYVAGMEEKVAIATSLFVVGVTSLGALIPHARAGRVQWRAGAYFGVAAMAAAYLGGRAADLVSGGFLMVAFALMMLATSIGMIRGRKQPSTSQRDEPGRAQLLQTLAQGAVVGFVTGMIGAGGGFLIVPALVLLGGMPMSAAVATSLMVIVLKSFSGLAGHLANVQIDWSLAVAITAAAILGSVFGARLSGVVPAEVLRRGFGWFVLAMGVFILFQQTVLG